MERISTNDYYPYGMVMSSTNGGTTNPDAEKYGCQSKERDEESKYDYFEARLYDSATGRFLQVDAYADKYTAMNPYMGMGGNPLSIIDPDGKEIVVTREDTGKKDEDGNIIYKYNVTYIASITNTSNTSFSENESKKIKTVITKSIQDTYGNIEGAETSVTVKLNTDESKIQETDHIIEIVNHESLQSDNLLSQGKQVVGQSVDKNTNKAKIGGNKIKISDQVVAGAIKNGWTFRSRKQMKRTASHEFGHNSSLTHKSGNGDKNNVMTERSSGSKATKDQIEFMEEKNKPKNNVKNKE